jgi:hypothetical protein
MLKDKIMEKFFPSDISDRERACFEVGIKLGALYHIASGMPVTADRTTLKNIEKGIESSISCQPYVKSVKIHLDEENIRGNKMNQFDYDEICGRNLKAEIALEYKNVHVIAIVEWIKKVDYPLMYIASIKVQD